MASDPLKILMLAPTPYFADRGCHVRIFEEARILRALGHDVQIVTYHLGRDMPDIPTVRIPRVPWYGKLAAGPSWHKPYLDILLLVSALRHARRFAPDLIHAHLHEGAFIGLLLKKLIRRPLLFDCQGSLTTELVDHAFVRRGSWLFRMFRYIEGIVNHGADFIITSSHAGAADLTGSGGVTAGRVRGIIDGVDTAFFRPRDRREARKALGLPDCPTVVFLGVLNRYQGIDLLLEVMSILRDRQIDCRFLVMGFPDAAYRERAEALGLETMATFTGRIDYAQAPLWLAAGDLAVSPKLSLTEANGKLFNYMACGLPTIAFDNPINREILGDDGVYARPGDAADFASRIQELLADPSRRADLAIRVRERAEREHSWRSRGGEIVAVYREVLRSSGR